MDAYGVVISWMCGSLLSLAGYMGPILVPQFVSSPTNTRVKLRVKPLSSQYKDENKRIKALIVIVIGC